MAQHVWTVLCESSAVDKYSNQASLFSAIESLGLVFGHDDAPPPDGTISVPVHMRLVSYWTRTRRGKAERAELRMSLELPGKRVIHGQTPQVIDLESAPRARTICQITSIRYGGPGEYAMLIDYRSAPSS